jgi:hypothetical protein
MTEVPTFLSYLSYRTKLSEPTKTCDTPPSAAAAPQRRLLEGSNTRISAAIKMLIRSADDISTEERPLQHQDGAQPREKSSPFPCHTSPRHVFAVGVSK